MRALEVPLQVLAQRCGLAPNANWNTILNQIEAQIRQRREDRDIAEDRRRRGGAARRAHHGVEQLADGRRVRDQGRGRPGRAVL